MPDDPARRVDTQGGGQGAVLALPVAPALIGARGERMLRVLGLNSSAWGPRRQAWKPSEEPDPFGLDRRLRTHGVAFEPLDPNGRPLNPFAGGSPMLEGLDPLRALRVLLQERQVDVLVCGCEGPAVLPLLLRKPLRFRPPVMLADPILSDDWTLRRRVLDLVVPRADAISVISSFQRDHIRQRWGRSAGVEVLGHTIDDRFWHAFPFVPDGPVISVGDDHSRDYDLLLAAWDGLAPRTDLLIRTSRIAKDRSLPPGTTVLRERLPYHDLRDLYARSRFVVAPLKQTLNAGGINAILEAMATGRAAVVSENAAIRDFLRHEETCLVVPPGDVEALRAAMARLLAEPETCARLGANARRMVDEALGADAYAARYAAFFRRLAGRGS